MPLELFVFAILLHAGCLEFGKVCGPALQSSFPLLTWEWAMKKTNDSGSGRSLLTDIYSRERADDASGVLWKCCEFMYTPRDLTV